MSYLEFKNLNKSFGDVKIIQDVSLEIEQGELIVFVGPSGCGKSTLLRMLSGLETVSYGDILLEDVRLNNVEPANRGVAMVFQSYALYPHMTVMENMGFSLRVNHVSKPERAKRVKEAAKILQLEDLLDRKPSELSGGQKQRVAIGRAIVRQPKIFLFDEPLSNLDAELRVTMRAEILNLHRNFKSTMIYVTHDQVEAMTLADRIVVLKGGVVQQFDTPLKLYDDPDNQFVAGFIGSPRMNFLHAERIGLKKGQAEVRFKGAGQTQKLKTNIDLSLADNLIVGIRPDHFAFDEPFPKAPFIETKFEYVEEMGGSSYIHLSTTDGSKVVALRHGTRIASNDLKRLWFDPKNSYFFKEDGARIR